MTVKKREAAPEKAAGADRERRMSPAEIDEAIAERAYEIYRKRGIAVSSSEELLKDWQQADREIREKYGLRTDGKDG